MNSYFSNGKLLLTSEYGVLGGAKALALPCKKGQNLEFKKNNTRILTWKSYDYQNSLWFEATFIVPEIKIKETSDSLIAKRLQNILNIAKSLNKSFLNLGGEVKTSLEFDFKWGLGSSSTLISNIALWAKINPYSLGESSFGGSGYDIACGLAKGPIFFTRNSNKPIIQKVNFSPSFTDKLFFVNLNKKMNSQNAVKNFDLKLVTRSIISKLNTLTDKIAQTKKLSAFEELITQHEFLIGKLLKKNPIKRDLFPDFNGSIKSLGAWGGDFFLATGDRSEMKYFYDKGFTTIIPYRQMCL